MSVYVGPLVETDVVQPDRPTSKETITGAEWHGTFCAVLGLCVRQQHRMLTKRDEVDS